MKEQDIRPSEVFDRFLELVEQDAALFFSDAEKRAIPCPCCGAEGRFSLTKFGMDYARCPVCRTLFLNPLPDEGPFLEYYGKSESMRFMEDVFYKKTEAKRRESLWRDKVQAVLSVLGEDLEETLVVDIGGGMGIFAEEFKKVAGKDVVVIEQSAAFCAQCEQKGIQSINAPLQKVMREQLPQGQLLFTSFELFEHLYDPNEFLSVLSGLMRKGDRFLFTTLSGVGADIVVLHEKAKAVSPPNHVNFFSPFSIDILLKRHSLDLMEVTTPGKLDLDILLNNRKYVEDRFWGNLFALGDKDLFESAQDFLRQNLLSSHMQVVCRKV